MSVEKIVFTVNQESKPFTTHYNSVLQNLHNGYALAIFCYLSSLPPNWQVMRCQLMKHFAWGRDRINSALKHLEKCGLIEVGQKKLDDGKFGHSYINVKSGQLFVTDIQIEQERKTAELLVPREVVPLTDFPRADKPYAGFSTAIKEIDNKININIKKKEKEPHSKNLSSKNISSISEDFQPSSKNTQFSIDHNLNIDFERMKFIAYFSEKETKRKNWQLSFQKWLINAAEYKQERMPKPKFSASQALMASIQASKYKDFTPPPSPFSIEEQKFLGLIS